MACTPEALSDSAAEFQGGAFKYLLALTAATLADGESPATLAESSNCLTCYSKKELLALWLAALCEG